MKLNYSGDGFSTPFPHTIIENFLDADTVADINKQWPTAWDKESGSFTLKWNTQALPPAAEAVVSAIDLKEIEAITGIPGLLADPNLFGAGLHCIPPGGFLNMHCDFNRHPNGWRRRVNMLIYLNPVWNDDWHGHLILSENGKTENVKIAPLAGRAVIFETTKSTWHGHPFPLACPEVIQRRSLALYFYTDDFEGGEGHSTVYRKKSKGKN